jgi:hypothetical protein
MGTSSGASIEAAVILPGCDLGNDAFEIRFGLSAVRRLLAGLD